MGKGRLLRSLIVLGTLLSSCGSSTHDGGDADAGPDGDADADGDVDADADGDGDLDCEATTRPDAIDLLVVMDSAESMLWEQNQLTTYFDELLSPLLFGEDRDGDGADDDRSHPSLRLAAITGDMGAGSSCPFSSDDGLLLHGPASGDAPGCSDEPYPLYLEDTRVESVPSEERADALTQDFSCNGLMSRNGCVFQQHLAALRAALVTHAADENAGFLREGSLLTILVVSDKDDCSIAGGAEGGLDLFDPEAPLGPMDLRCAQHPELLAPVDGFVADLLAVRPCADTQLAVLGMFGLPSDGGCLGPDSTQTDVRCLLDMPLVRQVPDESGEHLVPSCESLGRGNAYPPRRLLDFVGQAGAAGAHIGVASLCQGRYRDDLAGFGAALRAMVEPR